VKKPAVVAIDRTNYTLFHNLQTHWFILVVSKVGITPQEGAYQRIWPSLGHTTTSLIRGHSPISTLNMRFISFQLYHYLAISSAAEMISEHMGGAIGRTMVEYRILELFNMKHSVTARPMSLPTKERI